MASPPTSPYCTAAQMSYLLHNMFKGIAPSASTTPTDTVVEMLITWGDSVIDMQFQSVGYKIPFLTLSGETWPAHQSTWLQFLSAVAAASMAGGHILGPAPAMRPGRARGERDVYALMINKFFDEVGKHGAHFRAQHYQGTKAERWLTEPQGPRTDFMQDYLDPTRYELLHAYTDRLAEVFVEIQEMDLEWDYFFPLRSAGAD